ncbi:MAG: glutamate mutase L [Bacillota bacterium]
MKTPSGAGSTAREWLLVTDVGSTTTKTLAFKLVEGHWRLASWVQEPTTVEAPDEDVMIGLTRGLQRLSEICGVNFLTKNPNPSGSDRSTWSPNRDVVQTLLASSSAGGGLGILACGATLANSARAAQRVALGAGGVILDIITPDDGRPLFEKFALINSIRPDMILMAGGVDGGNTSFVLELMDLLNAAHPSAKFGKDFRIPIVYAGNADAAPLVTDSAADCFSVKVVPNIQPTLDTEQLAPAREAIQQLFMEHVMAHAPGYDHLIEWVDAPVLPTPGAVSRLLELAAGRLGRKILAVDIGGATTDVYTSGSEGIVRTVAANVGMSYSAPHVLARAGLKAAARWLPEGLDPTGLETWVASKGVYPSLVPHYQEDLAYEHALARAAINLAVGDHFGQRSVDWPGLRGFDVVIGSGGVLSHAPLRSQAASILMDALLPASSVELFVDNLFMMPHLGVMSQISPDDALDVLFRECLVPVGVSAHDRWVEGNM